MYIMYCLRFLAFSNFLFNNVVNCKCMNPAVDSNDEGDILIFFYDFHMHPKYLQQHYGISTEEIFSCKIEDYGVNFSCLQDTGDIVISLTAVDNNVVFGNCIYIDPDDVDTLFDELPGYYEQIVSVSSIDETIEKQGFAFMLLPTTGDCPNGAEPIPTKSILRDYYCMALSMNFPQHYLLQITLFGFTNDEEKPIDFCQ